MSYACATCDRTDNAPSFMVAIVGMVCADCLKKLSSPTLLEGAVEGPPLKDICEATTCEFHDRRTRLQQNARDICKPPTAPVNDRREGRD